MSQETPEVVTGEVESPLESQTDRELLLGMARTMRTIESHVTNFLPGFLEMVETVKTKGLMSLITGGGKGLF